MQIGWIDYSAEEKKKIVELIKLLDNLTTLDELGIGRLRDAISEKLYPGISTLQTRAKYFLLVPYLFYEVIKRAKKNDEVDARYVSRRLDEFQDKIVRILVKNSGVENGIIGSNDVNHPVKIKPSRIYWNGLRISGILKENYSFNNACFETARFIENSINNERLERQGNGGSDDKNVISQYLDFFMCPTKFEYKHACIQLTKDEAVFLKEQFTSCAAMRGSLIAYFLNKGVIYDDFFDIRCTEIDGARYDNLGEYVRLAQEFSRFIDGPQIVYNLIFSKGKDELAYDEWKSKYFEWKQKFFDGVCDIPDLDAILGLLDGNESKYALYKKHLECFINKFCEAVKDNPDGECSEREMDVVRKRERNIKNNESKLDKPDYEYRRVASYRLVFRHDTAKVIINDILNGLEEKKNV